MDIWHFIHEQCGEIVYAASVMEKIDDLLEHLEKVASKIFIVDYAEANCVVCYNASYPGKI